MPHMFKNTPLKSWVEQCSDLYNVDGADDATLSQCPLQNRHETPHTNVSWQQVRDQFNSAAVDSEGPWDSTQHQAFVDLWTLYVMDNLKAEK
jgi:hypothetical protein